MKRMKLIWFVAGMLFFAGNVLAKSDLTLVDANGVTNEWTITFYKPPRDDVQLKGSAGYTNRPFGEFSESDQQKIIGWYADKSFKSSSGLRVKIEKEETHQEKGASKQNTYRSYTEGKVTTVFYIITFENRSEVELTGVKVEYQIFYETEDGSIEANRRVADARSMVIPCGKTVVLESESISIRDQKIVTPGFVSTVGEVYGGKPTVYMKDRLKGMHVRVSREDSSGKLVVREYKNGSPPKKSKWAEYKKQK